MKDTKASSEIAKAPAAARPLRCVGVTKAGNACRAAARWPVHAPAWCWNCDPSKREERCAAGATRHRRFGRQTRLAESERDPMKMPRVDFIVDACLDTAAAVEAGTLGPAAGAAVGVLLKTALAAMKARDSLGRAPYTTTEDVDSDGPPAKTALGRLERLLDM